MTERHYDIVLYGASGFTGRQAVHYFAEHTRPGTVRWAIAGRNRDKLDAVKAALGAASGEVDILVADSQDASAVEAIVAQTRVMLNTAGPFALYGNAIVDACVRLQTHYVDITGETPWVRELIDRYHAQAASTGTRIIPCCGFDSVPSDLGTYLVVRHLQNALGVPCRAVNAYFQAFGGFNGGTLASVFNLYDSGQTARLSEPFLLSPGVERSKQEIKRNRDPLLPHYASDIGAWVGPFFMGPVNTRVVRRSQALFEQWQNGYGPQFTYQEYLKFSGPFGLAKAGGVTAAMTLVQGAMPIGPVRRLLKIGLPKPGSGPSESAMDRGWFRCELIGLADEGRRVRGLFSARGDPGNRATVKMLCESALSLALHADELPGGLRRGGILTPATGLGEVLAKRLRAAGMRIEVGG